MQNSHHRFLLISGDEAFARRIGELLSETMAAPEITIESTMERPRPAPPCWRERDGSARKKRSNTRSADSVPSPGRSRGAGSGVDQWPPEGALELDSAVVEVDQHHTVGDQALPPDRDALKGRDRALLSEHRLGTNHHLALVDTDLGVVADP